MQVFPIDIIEGCKKSNGKSQRSLFDFYYAYMYNVCLRYVKDDMHAEDMLSMGFTKVFKHITQFNYEAEVGLRAWIKKIMINECLMWLRKKNNFNLVPITAADDLSYTDFNLHEMDVQYILQAMSDLPVGYKTVLNLYVIEGYNHAEIGQMLNIKEATSRSQLNKAKQLLKQRLLQFNQLNYGKG
jgi:RNA polymerase sigma factor (sigma-70 family)